MINSIEVTNSQGSITYETETDYGLNFKFETYGHSTYLVISDIVKTSENWVLKDDIKTDYKILAILNSKHSITNIEYGD